MIYDPEADIISWEIAKGPISHAREVGNLIIHLGKGGKPILIEMLEASSFVGQFEQIKDLGKNDKIIPQIVN
jgi:uncharacterized protein YuzE